MIVYHRSRTRTRQANVYPPPRAMARFPFVPQREVRAAFCWLSLPSVTKQNAGSSYILHPTFYILCKTPQNENKDHATNPSVFLSHSRPVSSQVSYDVSMRSTLSEWESFVKTHTESSNSISGPGTRSLLTRPRAAGSGCIPHVDTENCIRISKVDMVYVPFFFLVA